MATLELRRVIMAAEARTALERAAEALPDSWHVLVVGHETDPLLLDVSVDRVDRPRISQAFRDGGLEGALSFLEGVRLDHERRSKS